MIKMHEMSDPDSCFNRAAETEMLFVLLGRDEAAAATIEFWCGKRIELGKNKVGDKQIADAMYCARVIERRLHG